MLLGILQYTLLQNKWKQSDDPYSSTSFLSIKEDEALYISLALAVQLGQHSTTFDMVKLMFIRRADQMLKMKKAKQNSERQDMNKR